MPSNERLVQSAGAFGGTYLPIHRYDLFSGTPYIKYFANAGVTNAIGNYSAAITDFTYKPASNERFIWHTLDVMVADNGNFNQTDYGAITGGLTNGIKFFIKVGSIEIPLLAGTIVKQNNDWLTLTHGVTLTTFAGTAQTLQANFDLINDFGAPIVLDGLNDVTLIIRLNDDFTTLTAQKFTLKGLLVTS